MRPITGFRRADGCVGIRNHVVVLPMDALSNASCERIAAIIPGVRAIPHGYGRVQFGDELDLMFATLIGTGSNANVAAVVVVGNDDMWTDRVVAGIAETGKPVVGLP